MNQPQFTIQDFGSANFENASMRSAKLLRGSSWKKTRIVVVLPAGDMMSTKVALSQWNLIFPPNQPVLRILAQGMEVGDAYSGAIQNILDHPELSTWEYMLTVEHDNMPPQDGVLNLIAQMEAHPEYSCIGGLYYTKGETGVAQIWGDPNDPVLNFRPQLPQAGKLVECCGTGMGFNLWRISMFKDPRLKKPWFKTIASRAEGVGTQDLNFWGDARKYGYRCAIDCNITVGHYDYQTDIVW